MRIRFLQTTDSEVAGFPFRPGQVIEVSRLNRLLDAAVRDGRAELVREPADDTTIIAPAERAVTKGKRR